MQTNDGKYWWKADKKDLAQSVHKSFDRIVRYQNDKLTSDKRHLKLYGKLRLSSMRDDLSLNVDFGKLKYNLIKSAVDTMESKISKNNPKARFLTNRGNYESKTRAQKLECFIDGVNYKESIYKKTRKARFQSYIMGTGWVKRIINEETMDVRIEHVPSYMVFVDEDDCIDGFPQQIYEARFISRETLIDLFPKMKSDLEKATSKVDPFFNDFLNNNLDPDVLFVVEAHRVGSGKNKGRHTIEVEGTVVLVDREYSGKKVPYNFIHYKERSTGFYGEGMAEILTPIQVELNKALLTKQEIIQFCKPKIYIQDGDTIVTNHLDDDVGTIVKYSIAMPQALPLMGVPVDLDNHINWIIQYGYEQVGLNQQTASGQKPAELESGIALREFNDIESERFSMIAKSSEDFHMEIWRDLIEDMNTIAKNKKGIQVTLLDREGIRKIKWEEIYLPEDDFVMQSYPVNLLSSTPAGKLADVKTLADMGAIDKDQMFALLDFPDVNEFYETATAWKRSVERMISEMIEENKYYPPDERSQYLPQQMELMLSNYMIYQADGVPEDKLELMTRWLDDALAIQNERMQVANEQMQQQQMDQVALEQQANIPPEGSVAPLGVSTGETGAPIPEEGLPPELLTP